jgi:RNA polymerase sigma-70 factor (ECF subfamily)
MTSDPAASSGPNRQPRSDASLLRRLQLGEPDAATELYHRYAARLIELAAKKASPDLKQRVDPEDIVQSVFRTFFRRASLGEYEVPDGDELWKLFLVIGLNKVRAVAVHHKAAKRDVRQTGGGDAVEIADAATPDETARRTLELTIEELLAPLPKTQREIVRLRIDGYEVAEIASRVGRAKRSVERILQEFRQKLQGVIDDAR